MEFWYRRFTILTILVAVGFVFILFQWPSTYYRTPWREGAFPSSLLGSSQSSLFSSGIRQAGNTTLGFQAILALSRGTKWRVDGLRAASRSSGIHLDIPAQPQWSEPFVKAFQAFGPVEAHGAAMAWLGHIDLIKMVILNGWGSALILEDDMDWDVDIRSQTPRIAKAVTQLTNETNSQHAPYGTGWDILWLGHCSDPPPSAKNESIIFEDPSTIDIRIYRGLNPFVKSLLQTGQRMVHYSINPVCTFAYAVSAAGAPKLLAHASLGQGGAFDLMLMHACQDKLLRCVSVNPEIFHPYQPVEDGTSEVRAGDAGNAFNQEAGKEMGWTENVRNSARCKGQFNKRCQWVPGIDGKEVEVMPVDKVTNGDSGATEVNDAEPANDAGAGHDAEADHNAQSKPIVEEDPQVEDSLDQDVKDELHADVQPHERLRMRPFEPSRPKKIRPLSIPEATDIADTVPAGWADA